MSLAKPDGEHRTKADTQAGKNLVASIVNFAQAHTEVRKEMVALQMYLQDHRDVAKDAFLPWTATDETKCAEEWKAW